MAQTAIPDFSTTIKKGYNLSLAAGFMYNGTATYAQSLLIDGVPVPASSFSRNDVQTVANVSISTTSIEGISIGPSSALVANISPLTGHVGVYSNAENKDVILVFYCYNSFNFCT